MYDDNEDKPIVLPPAAIEEEPELRPEDLVSLDVLRVESPAKRQRKTSGKKSSEGRRRWKGKERLVVEEEQQDHGLLAMVEDLMPEDSDWGGTGFVDEGGPSPEVFVERGNSMSAYEDFVEGVGMGAIGLYQISKSIFVCEGWDSLGGNSTGRWHHMQQIDLTKSLFVCTCPSSPSCFHEKYMGEESVEAFPGDMTEYSEGVDSVRDLNEILTGAQDEMCQTILFYRELSPDALDTTYIFSVVMPFKPDVLKAQAIVIHQGQGNGVGSWTCSRESSNTSQCVHIGAARKRFTQITGTELEEEPQPDNAAVSFLPILPPIWAGLPEDEKWYSRMRFEVPQVIELGDEARCSCGATRVSGEGLTVEQNCTIYHITEALEAKIEVEICHKCSRGRRRYVGPDGR
ncbi:hypothetical protein C8J57DRAFT_1259480 [Mycena rebaudengoi]|nr:hypothetical protein C8J57DRAFT_1259480 [Mycena rebaudengoi]